MVSLETKKKRLSKYWVDRQKEQERFKLRDYKEIEQEVKRMYSGTQNAIEKEIESFYARYAGKEGITKDEAKKRASQFDIKQFEDKAKQYVKEKNFTEKANQELRLYNLKMRTSRLELLERQIELELLALGSEEERMLIKRKTEGFIKAYEEQSGILGMSTPTKEETNRMVQVFIDKPYHGANFKERIWGRNERIRDWLAKNIHKEVLRGKNPRDVVPKLRRLFDVGTYEAERLAITEYGYIQSEVQRISYEEAEVEWYDLMIESDACDVCVGVAEDGPYPVDEMVAGVNAPMVHPFCKCGTAPNTDRDRELLERMFEELSL